MSTIWTKLSKGFSCFLEWIAEEYIHLWSDLDGNCYGQNVYAPPAPPKKIHFEILMPYVIVLEGAPFAGA